MNAKVLGSDLLVAFAFPEVCVFFLKAPALALDVTSGPAKLFIACGQDTLSF